MEIDNNLECQLTKALDKLSVLQTHRGSFIKIKDLTLNTCRAGGCHRKSWDSDPTQLRMVEVEVRDLGQQVVTLQSPQLRLSRIDINTHQSVYHMTTKVHPRTCQDNPQIKEVAESPQITSVLAGCQISSHTK